MSSRGEVPYTVIPGIANNLQVKNQKASSSQPALRNKSCLSAEGRLYSKGSEARMFELPVSLFVCMGTRSSRNLYEERTTSGGLNRFRELEKRVREFFQHFASRLRVF